MIDKITLVVTVTHVTASQGVAWHLFRSEGAIIVPLALTLANVLGTVMKFYFTKDMSWIILPMYPITAVSILSALFMQRISTCLLMLGYMAFHAMGWYHMAWLIKWAFRKEVSELKAIVRDRLYKHHDYIGYSNIGGPLEEFKLPEKGKIVAIRTGMNTGERMSQILAPEWTVGPAYKGETTVTVNPGAEFQKFMGFGGAFTESSAELLLQMGKGNQELIIDAYFSPTSGLNYEIGRLHMNSCDFSRGNWSCCDVEGDWELKHFSIERYHQAILPMVKRAVAAAKRPLTLFASPWSPPAWMKDTGRMCGGGKLKEDCRQVWAKFYVKFAEALRDAGYPLWGFSVQNEPDGQTPWENCLYSAEEERDFVRDHLGPAVEASEMDLKIIAWDHNRDELLRRADYMYSDPECAKHIWGMGWHWYGDPSHEWWADANGQRCFDNVQRVHDFRPDKHLIVTEVCQELGAHIGDYRVGERYAESIIHDFQSWNEAWVDWNLILDASGGHNHVGNLCSAPIICDPAKDRVIFNPSYYYIGHFSRYIQPGAVRIQCASSRDMLEVTAFKNPDETIVLVVLNQMNGNMGFCLNIGPFAARAEAVARTITTYLIRP